MDKKALLDLLHDMSREEKIDQLLQLLGDFYSETAVITGPAKELGITEDTIKQAGSILGCADVEQLMKIQEEYRKTQPHHIPMLFMADVINGFKTSFPISLAQGCSFDPKLVEECAQITAAEAAVSGLHVTFAPMVDLVRDARWGRVMESTGEDVYLNCCMAKAMVKGLQGDDISKKGKIASCVKHFAAYGMPTAGREYGNVELSERSLREDYLPAYQAAIEAGCELVMTSFNTIGRIPATANKYLLRDVLRGEMQFDGVVISDYNAIEELIHHGVADSEKMAARLGIEAGVDIDMMSGVYPKYLKELIEEGSVSEELLDEAVLRVLNLKNKLGLFENPIKDADIEESKKVVLCKEHRKKAEEMAAASFVLLKNEEILPLDKTDRNIVFIGPYCDEKEIYGAWSVFANSDDSVSIKEGIENLFGSDAYTFIKGCERLGAMEEKEISENSERIKKADVVVMLLGEDRKQSGECASRANITLPDGQMELYRSVRTLNDNIVTVVFSGRPLDLREVNQSTKALLQVWFPGTEGGNAIAKVLFGYLSPSGKLSMSFPYSVGQVPVFYSDLSTGRPYIEGKNKDRYRSIYIDIPNDPLYPFGYGLTYTKFSYGKLSLDQKTLKKGEVLKASIFVKNIGKRIGQEIVQLYIRDLVGSVARPIKELKGFKKITLLPGEEKEVVFEITEDMLSFYKDNMEYGSEPGNFEVMIGADSRVANGKIFELV